jgi:hypothetical protein
MWDALEATWTEKSHLFIPYGPAISGQYPLIGTNRWYNTNVGVTASATASAKECSTINELAYYAFQGHPSWDGDITWSVHKHLYKGGMWFLKCSNIPNFNKNEYGGKSLLNTCPNPWVENYPARHKIPAQGRPSDLDKYFFLPATGYCGDQTVPNIDKWILRSLLVIKFAY